jgi:predicted nucleic acid-binding protein
MYWDTSAILKLYVAEPDSPYFLALLADADRIVATSAITPIEILCALHRKERAGDLKRGASRTIFEKYVDDTEKGRIVEIPFGPSITTEADSFLELASDRRKPPMIRSLDAIHIASALAGRAKSLVTTDRRLAECARLARLKVLP